MSRAIHVIGSYDRNTWIGGTPLMVSKGVPYEGTDADLGIAPGDSGYIGLIESPSQTMLVNVDDALLGSGEYPLRITPQQWHKFNFLIRELEVSGAPAQNDGGSKWADSYANTVQPVDETELLKFPGLWWRKYVAAQEYMTFGVGIPSDAYGVAPDTEVFPFASTYPVVVTDWTFASGLSNLFGDHELVSLNQRSVLFAGGWLSPYLKYFLQYRSPWGNPTRLFTGSPSRIGFGPPSTEYISTGFALKFLDWGSVPLTMERQIGDPVTITSDIVFTASKHWTYNGLYNEITGQATGPIPNQM